MKTVPPHAPYSPPPRHRNYHQQFQMINQQNQELIRLADTIARSSFMHPSYPSIIAQTEHQLRKNLGIFVDSIREFFVDIDNRLRALAYAFEQDISREQQHRMKRVKTQDGEDMRQQQSNQNIVLKINQMTDPYQVFSEKITALEVSLKKTQDNEARLLEIVEKLSKRSEALSSSPHHNYPRPQLRDQYSRKPSNSSLTLENSHETSFRLFSLHNRHQQQQQQRQEANTRKISYSPFVCTSNNERLPHKLQGSPQGHTIYDNSLGQNIYDSGQGNIVNTRPLGQTTNNRPQGHTIYDSNINHGHRANFLLKTLIS